MRRSLLLVAGCLIVWPCGASAQSLPSIEKAWESQRYPDPQNEVVRKELVQYWKSPGGRTWEVAYMIGTSECRMPGLQPDGQRMLGHALDRGRLTAKQRDVIQRELDQCRVSSGNGPAEVPSPSPSNTGELTAGVVGYGKGGYLLYGDDSKATSIIMTSPISADDLLARRIPVGSDDDRKSVFADVAMDHVYDLLRPALGNYIELGHAQVDQFLIFSSLPDNAVAKRIGACLVPYRASLARDFGMTLPPDMVIVYAVPFLGEVGQYAKALHRIQISPGTVAYSMYEDLSIVGMAGEESCGTLAHELTHLMVRGSFGDAPPWLEEGLASEVAVGTSSGSTIVFMKSWRDEMLRREWTRRPTLAALIDGNWDMFQAKSQEDLERAAAVSAMAASFVRYLDKRGVLRTVYSQIRDGELKSDLTQAQTPKEILERAMNEPVAGIEREFNDWFDEEFKPRRPETPVTRRSTQHSH
jgi:hypothetical protein